MLQNVKALPGGKRETGLNPVRSRHCVGGAYCYYVTDFVGKAAIALRYPSQETCRLSVQGRVLRSRSRGIGRTFFKHRF